MPTASTLYASTRKASFYQQAILGMFLKMKLGTLRIILPEGKILEFGNGIGMEAEIRVINPDFFRKCFLFGDIGFGESYVDGDWETGDITTVIKWFLLNIEQAPSVSGSKAKSLLLNILKIYNQLIHFKNTNTVKQAKDNISAHYDLNNSFFSLFLDPSMTYSSAFFREPGMNLEQAQQAKYERLCQQLKLQPNDHVLEIGSGWGSNAIYMAKQYGCRVTSVTISEEQFKWASQKIREENLADRIELRLQDYRQLGGTYDKIVSIEMIEAVGANFLDTYFKICASLLKKDGILAIQAITCPDSRFESLRKGVDWIQKHIFPGSLLPSVSAINKAINKTSDLTMVDLKDIGLDYATTLKMWRTEFNRNLQAVYDLGFTDNFIRKWNYYLSYCEAAFAMRNIHVMQMVYTRPNNLSR